MKFFIIVIANIVIFVFMNFFLKIDEILISDFTSNLSIEQISKFLEARKKLKYFTFLFICFLLFIKILVVTSALYIGTFFYSKTKVTFKQLWNIVVKAEFVFLLVGVLKIIWFYFFQTSYTLEDLQYFYPLSILNIVGYKGLDAWFIYPLQILNLFELAYWLILAYYIGKIASPAKNFEGNNYKMDFGLKIVATSYGSALLLWVVVVMFFTLNYS